MRDTCQCCIFVLDLVRCQVLMAASVTVIAFWDIAPYSLVEVDLRSTPETSVSLYEASRTSTYSNTKVSEDCPGIWSISQL
jgi:hypothetical protein